MAIKLKQFYSTADAAKVCQVSRGSVLRWIREGRLKAATTIGGHHRIQSSDLMGLAQDLGVPVPVAEKNQGIDQTPKKILIVEDDIDICRLVERALEQIPAETKCRVARDGLHAGWVLSKFIPDLVFLDLHMPNIDGYEVCKLLRSEPAFEQTKIVAISTFETEKKERILSLGAHYFLSKPFEIEEIEDVIQKQLFGFDSGEE